MTEIAARRLGLTVAVVLAAIAGAGEAGAKITSMAGPYDGRAQAAHAPGPGNGADATPAKPKKAVKKRRRRPPPQ